MKGDTLDLAELQRLKHIAQSVKIPPAIINGRKMYMFIVGRERMIDSMTAGWTFRCVPLPGGFGFEAVHIEAAVLDPHVPGVAYVPV